MGVCLEAAALGSFLFRGFDELVDAHSDETTGTTDRRSHRTIHIARRALSKGKYRSRKVCPDFCVNGRVLFLGMGSGEGGSSPSPDHLCRSAMRVHCVLLSKAGIRSGQRIVKWFKASRQWWIGMVHFFAACRRARNSNFSAASSLGNPPRVLMILRSDRFSDSTLLVV